MVNTPAGKKRVIDALLQDRSPIDNWELINNIATYRTEAVTKRGKKNTDEREEKEKEIELEMDQEDDAVPLRKLREEQRKIPQVKKCICMRKQTT